MTSEYNSSSYDHSKFQSRASNPQYLNPGFPNRKPTEGEIDQFIELLKNSSTGNQSDDNIYIENNATQTHTLSDLKTEVIHFKTDSVVRSPSNKSNARVVLNDDGILMKTIHVQSQEGYVRESERFEQKLPPKDYLKQDETYKSSSAYHQATNDYLRKTTFLNKKSELKVTISRDQEKTRGSSVFESRGLISGSSDIDTQLLPEEMDSKKLLERETYSRDLGRSPHVKESFIDEFCDSSSYSKCSSKPHPVGSEIRSSPTPPMYTQRRPYSGDVRNQREGSPYYYSENTSVRLKGRKDSSPNRSYHGRDKHSRYPPLSPQRSRTPSPHRRRRNSRDKEFYNPHEEVGFAVYGMQIHSPEIKERRTDVRYDTKSPITIPSPPSPPPPPVLSVMKKKKTKLKSEEEQSKTKKTSTNPLSTLLADRNVSISTLLEAAIGNTGEKSSSTNWNPSAKADILSRCEEKIGQLYRHRVCGPGSFIPDPVPRPSPPYANNSLLVKHYPQLEFNSRSVNTIWHCPGVAEPDPQKNEIINIGDEDDKILSTHSNNSSRSKTKRAYSKGNDNNVTPDENPVSRIKTRIPLQGTIGTNMSTYESSVSYKSGHEQSGDYINCSEPWQQYGSDEGRSQYNASDTSYALSQQPAINASETYDPNNWSNSGGFNTFGYQQPQFENQQLVQYPVGHQPVGPSTQYVNNSNYFFGQNENSQFPASEFAQYPISQDMPHFVGGTHPDQWYPQNEENIQFPETVQYPLKQRPSVLGSDCKTSHRKNNSKLFVNRNLISLTDTEATYGNKETSPSRNLKGGDKVLPVSSSDDSKNKLKKNSNRCLVTPKPNNNKQQEIVGKEIVEKEIVEKDAALEKILQLNVKIRNIQLKDNRIYDIFKDLENGTKIYSFAYTVRHKMLWRKDKNKYKLYISEPIENEILPLFHETFHDLNETKLVSLAKKYLTVVPRIQEKLRYTIRVCDLCKRERSPKRIVGQSSVRRSRSPHNRSPLPPVARSNRSRSPSKKCQLRHLSPSSKKTSSKSTSSPTHHLSPTVSKERLAPGRDKSLSPDLQRHESRSLKRRRDSRSRAGRDRSRRRSKHRRRTSYKRHSMEREDRNLKKKSRSKESSEVETVAVIKLPSKNIEVINLVGEEINETDDQWISYDSVGPESEEETSSDSRNKTETKVDISNLDVKTPESIGNIKDLNSALECDKYVDRGNASTKLKENENQVQARMDSDERKQENKIQNESMDSQKHTNIKIINDQKSESSVEEHTVVIQKQEQEKENVNVNKTNSNLQKDRNSSLKQGQVEEGLVKKQEEKEEQENTNKDKLDKKSIEKVIIVEKEHCEDGIETSQKQESEEEDKAKNSSTNLQEVEGQILETDINQKKEEVSENTDSNKQENKPPAKLDFKTRVRNIQLENNELKDIIHFIEVNKQDKNVDPCYLIKGGMLCKKCQIGVKSEVRIVATIEQINDFVFTVHTMSTSHAPLQKTLMLFNKHFVPMPDIDKVVEEVVNGCHICN